MESTAAIDMADGVCRLTAAVFAPLPPQGGLQQFPKKQIMNVQGNRCVRLRGPDLQPRGEPIEICRARQAASLRQAIIIGGIWQFNSPDAQLLTKGEKVWN